MVIVSTPGFIDLSPRVVTSGHLKQWRERKPKGLDLLENIARDADSDAQPSKPGQLDAI